MSLKESFSGYNLKNSYTLLLLTLAYIVGEICHYLIGTLTKDMSRVIGYGDYACYLKNGLNTTFNSETCLDFNQKDLWVPCYVLWALFLWRQI